MLHQYRYQNSLEIGVLAIQIIRFKIEQKFTGKIGEDLTESISNYIDAANDYSISFPVNLCSILKHVAMLWAILLASSECEVALPSPTFGDVESTEVLAAFLRRVSVRSS
jgi:hypothetical protein